MEIDFDQDGIYINTNKIVYKFCNYWIKDSCTSEESVDKNTLQRRRTPDSLFRPDKINRVELENDTVVIEWISDTIPSRVPIRYFTERIGSKIYKKKYKSWIKNEVNISKIKINYKDFISRELSLKKSLFDLKKVGFTIIENTPCNIISTEAIANRIAFASKTFFGELGSIESSGDNNLNSSNDSAWSNSGIGVHNDGTYMDNSPGLQALHCIVDSKEGGESILVDGFRVAEEIKIRNKIAFDLLSTTDIECHYIDKGVYYRSSKPIISLDSAGYIDRISYNPYDRSRNSKPLEDDTVFYESLNHFHTVCNEDNFQLIFKLKPGEVLIFDNWRLLHGRNGFSGKRKLNSFYINRDDFLSTAKLYDIN